MKKKNDVEQERRCSLRHMIVCQGTNHYSCLSICHCNTRTLFCGHKAISLNQGCNNFLEKQCRPALGAYERSDPALCDMFSLSGGIKHQAPSSSYVQRYTKAFGSHKRFWQGWVNLESGIDSWCDVRMKSDRIKNRWLLNQSTD